MIWFGAARFARRKDFYETSEWLRLRYRVLRHYGGRCQLCGWSPKKGLGGLQVDHIKPRSKYPRLCLTFSNLQVLCRRCNLGKSNIYTDDWR